LPAPAFREVEKTMRKSVLKRSTALIACALCGLSSVALRAHPSAIPDATPIAQEAKAQDPKLSPQDAAGAKISGAWQINKELSTDATATAAGQQASRGGGSSGRGSTGAGGGSTGGRRGGAAGSGGGGASGGGGGGGGSRGGGGSSGPSPEQQAQLQAMLSEVKSMPERMTVHATATDLTVTLDDGSVRKYTANNKKEKIAIGSAEVDTTTKWDGDTINIQMSVGQDKLVETYALTSDGAHLLVSITPKLSRPGQQVTTKHVYDHIQ
jgi:hypothetical protein